MAVNRLYDTFFRQVRQLWPEMHLPVVRNLVWCLCGMYLSRSIQLQHIATYIPSGAKLVSVTRRLSRFLAGSALHVRVLYAPLAQAWLTAAAASVGEVRLILDSTQVSAHHQLVMVALAFRRRAIPMAWTWVSHQRGFSSACQQRALLKHVRSLLPPGVRVLLVGDSEFGSIELLRQLERWHWSYAVQQKSKHLVKLPHQQKFRALRRLVEAPGQRSWWPQSRLTKQELRTTVLIEWAAGEKEPWYLATNLASPAMALQAYRRRMWIEIVFTQMTKADLLTAGAQRNDITNLDIAIRDDDPVDEELYQLPFLLKGCLGEAPLHAVTKLLHRIDQTSQLGLTIHIGFQLLRLGFQPVLFLFQLLSASLVLGQRNHIRQIRFRQPFELMVQTDVSPA